MKRLRRHADRLILLCMLVLAAQGFGCATKSVSHSEPATDTAVPLEPNHTQPTGTIVVSNGPSSNRLTLLPLGWTAAAQGYMEYLPPGYGIGEHPLLVHLHGLGENGDGISDLYRTLSWGPPRLIAHDLWPEERPFIVLAPQHSGERCHTADEIRAFFKFALEYYEVDPTRVYLTGMSCGAHGTWNYMADNPDGPVAAYVPVCGNGQDAFGIAGSNLGRRPIWAFHGSSDSVVPVEGTTETIHNILSFLGETTNEIKVTIYPGVGHNAWERTYDLSAGHDIYLWMLRFTRP